MKPRLVILTTYYWPVVGGAESSAERLARYFAGHGYSVRVVTKRVERDRPDRETVEGIDVVRIGPGGPRSGAGKWQLMPFAAAWLVRHARSYDIVCCIDYRGIAIGALAARAWTRRPVLVQAQTTGVLSGDNAAAVLRRLGISEEGGVAPFLKWPARAAYRRADAFACISHEIEREVIKCGIAADRIHYLPNAIDMGRFRPATPDLRSVLRRELGLVPGAVACVYVGRLSREKGLMDLLEAWRLLGSTRGVLLIVGPDMEDHPWNIGPAARQFVKDHGLERSVRFLGSRGDVAPALQAADLLVQPSHFEALGLSPIEALACGVPVVASAVGGLLDFVKDGENGKLCPPQNPPALAQALRPLIDDDALRARLASRARASVAAEYDEEIVFSRFASILDRLAGAPQ